MKDIKDIEQLYSFIEKTKKEKLLAAIEDILEGLEGKPFYWDEEDYFFWSNLTRLGITLLAKTGIERHGFVLLPQQNPIGKVYFSGRIGKTVDVYLLEVQCCHKTESKIVLRK